jgi:hypothetical protein
MVIAVEKIVLSHMEAESEIHQHAAFINKGAADMVKTAGNKI